jgi:hypothetical protein
MHSIPGATEQSTSAMTLAGTTYLEGNEAAKIELTCLDTIITNRTGPPLGRLVLCIIQVQECEGSHRSNEVDDDQRKHIGGEKPNQN